MDVLELRIEGASYETVGSVRAHCRRCEAQSSSSRCLLALVPCAARGRFT